MSTKETGNLGLHSWEPFDAFTREEFNENFDKIDAAVESDRKGIAAAQSTADTARSEAQKAQSAANGARSAADAAAESTAAAFAALAADVSTIRADLGSGDYNCRIKCGSYKGNGKFGSGNKTSLTFDFYPVLVIIGQSFSAGNSNTRYGMLMRDCGGISIDYSRTLTATWTDTGVNWYCLDSGSAYIQMNESNTTYYYVVIGYSK